LYATGAPALPAARPPRTPSGLARRPAVPPRLLAIPAIPSVPGQFSWFNAWTEELPGIRREAPTREAPTREEVQPVTVPAGPLPTGPVVGGVPVAAAFAPAPAPAHAAAAASGGPAPSMGGNRRGNLQRRVPGAQLPTATLRAPEHVAGPARHDADAARSELDAFQTAIARAGGKPVPTPPGSAAEQPSLSRRTPGANLAPGLRAGPPGIPASRIPAPPPRDPEAERAAFDAYAAALAEAAGRWETDRPTTTTRPPSAREKAHDDDSGIRRERRSAELQLVGGPLRAGDRRRHRCDRGVLGRSAGRHVRRAGPRERRPPLGDRVGDAQPRPRGVRLLPVGRTRQGGDRTGPGLPARLHHQRRLCAGRAGVQAGEPRHGGVRDGTVRQPGQWRVDSAPHRGTQGHRRGLTAMFPEPDSADEPHSDPDGG